MNAKPFIPLSRLRAIYKMAQSNFHNWGGDSVSATFHGYVNDELRRLTIEQLQARIAELEVRLDICECSLIEEADLRLAAADALETTKDMLRHSAIPVAVYNTLMAALAIHRDECGATPEEFAAREWLRARGQPLQGRQGGRGAGEAGAPIATDSEP